MKKILASVLMLLAAFTATFAQHEVGSISIQPKVGVNIASLTKNDGGDPRWGFAGGAEFEYQATDIFSLSAGLVYSQEGAKNDYYVPGYKVTTKFDYLNIPVLANVYLTKGLAVKLGVQPGINVSSKDDLGDGEGVYESEAKDFSFSVPVGLSYEFTGVPFVIDVRYNWGLTHVASHADNKSSVFQITFGYKLDL